MGRPEGRGADPPRRVRRARGRRRGAAGSTGSCSSSCSLGARPGLEHAPSRRPLERPDARVHELPERARSRRRPAPHLRPRAPTCASRTGPRRSPATGASSRRSRPRRRRSGRGARPFRLTRPARVRMEAVRTDTVRAGRPSGETVWRTERSFRPGSHELVWKPAASMPPRTYVLRLTRPSGRATRTYGAHAPGRAPDGPVVRVQGVDVATTRSSYVPGEPADLTHRRPTPPRCGCRSSTTARPRRRTHDLRDGRRRGDTAGGRRLACPRRRAGPPSPPARGQLGERPLLRARRHRRRPGRLRAVHPPAAAPRHRARVPSSSRRTHGRPTTSRTRTGTAGATRGT